MKGGEQEKDRERAAVLKQYSAQQLEAAFENSAHLGVPNPNRTAICCDLLEKICGTHGRFRGLMSTLLPQLYRSIYKDFDERRQGRPRAGLLTTNFFFEGDARFSAVKTLVEQRQTLHKQLKEWEKELGKASNQMRNRDFMLKRVGLHFSASIVAQTFRAWKKVVETKHKDHLKLQMALRHFTSKNLKSLLRAWKLVAEESKRTKLGQGLELLRREASNCDDVRKELEEELLAVEKNSAGEKGKLDKKESELRRVRLELGQIKQEIALSKEFELQDIALQWQRLNFQLCNLQMSEMQHELQAVQWAGFQDPQPLLDEDVFGLPGEEQVPLLLSSLLQMPLDELMLRWVGLQLKKAQYPRKIQNFGSDLSDSEAYSALLHALTMEGEGETLEDKLTSADPFARSEEIIDRLTNGMTPPSPQILQPNDICDGVADKNLAQICFLFIHFPCMHPQQCQWTDAQTALDTVNLEWRVLHKKGTRGIGREGAAAEQKVSHSKKKKEVKFVGVQFEQLNSGYEQLERAKYLVDKRVRDRWATLQLWEALTRKVQQAAWDLLLQRGGGDPVTIPDRKQERELRLYTRVDTERPGGRLQELYAAGGYERHAEERHVRAHLVQHFTEIRRIFKHYAASEDGGGNNTMDLNEFIAFAKDGKLVDAETLPMSMVQRIFNESDQDVGGDSALNPDYEMNASEFVESLLRVAHAKYSKSDPTNENPQPALSLSQRLSKLTRQIERYACKSDADNWRKDLGDASVKSVLHKHRVGLEALYTQYAGEYCTSLLHLLRAVLPSTARHQRLLCTPSLVANCCSVLPPLSPTAALYSLPCHQLLLCTPSLVANCSTGADGDSLMDAKEFTRLVGHLHLINGERVHAM
jgi:hypothetical protein